MTTRELIESEIARLPDESLGELYGLVQQFAAAKAASSTPGIMSRLRDVRIAAPADFAANLDHTSCKPASAR